MKKALLFWDALVWLILIFPLLTGGVWIRQPGLKIELAELGVPALICAILGWAISYWGKADLSRASSMRFGARVWGLWRDLLERSPMKTLVIASLAVGALWSLASLRRHWAFGSGAADLGIFTNAISNLVAGRGYVSSVKDGMNLFADHQSPILWLLAPVFWVARAPETLLVIQGFGLAAGAIALYSIGAQYIDRKSWLLMALPLLYWAYMPLRNANAFDFHPETLMLPAFLAGIAGVQSQKTGSRLLGLLGLLVGLSAKESAGPVLTGIGIAWVLGAGPHRPVTDARGSSKRFTRTVGALSVIAGAAHFVFCTKYVPALFGSGYAYDEQYARFGTDLKSLLLAPFVKPDVFWPAVLGATRLKFLFWTLAPLAFIPLVNPRALVAALPGYAMLFLSQGDHRVAIIYHYSIEPAVGLFFALPLGLQKAEQLWMRHSPRLRSLGLSMPFVLLTVVLATFGRSDLWRIRIHSPTDHQAWLREQVLPCIDGASWATSGSAVPHLATRPWVHHLPRLEMPGGQKVGCVLYDPSINNWPMSKEDFETLPTRLTALNYSQVYSCDSVQIFKQGWDAGGCLKCIPMCIDARR